MEAAGGRAAAYAGDVAATDFVVGALAAFAGEAGGLDLLINNAVPASVAMPGFFRTGLLETMRAPAAESAMAQRLMKRSGYDAADAARAILAETARGQLYIVWPREYV